MTPTPEAAPAVTDDGRRSDARRNHERILQAALAVFAEKGADASIPEIAARAGVGKATVYRNYPTKADLISAITRDRLQWLVQRADDAADEADASAALRAYTDAVFTHIKSDRALCEALNEDTSPETMALRAGIRARLDTILVRGQEQGTVRADVTADELRVLVVGLSEQLHREGVTDRAVWRRYAGLVSDLLRPVP